jgi:hypothetical protein
MKLSLAFGIPLFLLRNLISSEELTLWRAFDEQDPISLHHRVDLAGGVIASANINKNIGDVSKCTKPSDFMPVLQAEKAEATKKSMSPSDLRTFMRREQAAREALKKKEQ